MKDHSRLLEVPARLFRLTFLLAAFALVPDSPFTASAPASESESAPSVPRIVSIERRGDDLVIRAHAPLPVARLVLESCVRNDLNGWIPRGIDRTTAPGEDVAFTVPVQARLEMFRVRADATDPLPAAFYTGATNFVGQPAGGPGNLPTDVWRGDAAAPPENAAADPRAVVESDIWVVEGDTLFFFNQFRGLQVIDIANPDAPRVTGTFPLPGMGEQMYLLDGRYAVLLAHDPCRQWGTDAESAMIVVDTSGPELVEVARKPIPGRVVESRLVGNVLYVATETWKVADTATGAWQSGTWAASFDLADPTQAVAREPLWFPGSGNVITATDRFLFIAITDYSLNWPYRSDLQIIDITAPDGTMTAFAKIALSGRVPDKFKIDLLDDVLRVVVEGTISSENARWVTVLETYRLADPRAVPAWTVLPLDRLELARGERLFATRFDGERAYIVTFERIDPLWVIDLSDPADLRISGELEIPGWSTYIRPLGDRLLTLGVDDARGWRVAVQLFDVSDPATPTLLAKVPLGEDSSWSEATQDEKAFGVFLEEGLLLVPISDWSQNGGKHGVQLIDLSRDSLKARGLLASNALVPRRATLHKDRVLAVTGRELIAANIADRDHPTLSASVELAYPVDRVLFAGDQRIEFAGNSLRTRSPAEPGSTTQPIELGEWPVLGASVRSSQLHVLSGRPATIEWEQPPQGSDWIARTNPGVLVATTWDISSLPTVTKLGEAQAPTDRTWLTDMQPSWVDDDLLVWATTSASAIPWWGWGGPAVDSIAGARLAPGLWMPWGYGGPRELIAVSITSVGVPKFESQTRLGESGDAAGEVFATGSLLFATRQKFESEVVETNDVIESIWFPTLVEPGGGATPSDATKPGVPRDAGGEWRKVTNSYPVLRWWSKYELDVVDFAPDPAAPIVRPALSVPGSLQGISHEGAMLYTTATRSAGGTDRQEAWLEASAYDGVAVHLVDSLKIANLTSNEVYAVTLADRHAYVARGGWQTDANQRLEVWQVNDTGRWEMGATAKLSTTPGELRRFNDLLLARNGGLLDLFGLTSPGVLEPLPTREVPGCYGGELSRAAGDRAHGLWLPLGEYGAVRVGP